MLRDVVMGIKLIKLSHVRFQEKHGLDLLKVCEEEVTHLEDQGFITVDDENITLTDQGLLYGDYVGRCLESKLKDWGTEAGTRARVRF
jgi:oxygen-independent coproporphyrinogen-3 oxidase